MYIYILHFSSIVHIFYFVIKRLCQCSMVILNLRIFQKLISLLFVKKKCVSYKSFLYVFTSPYKIVLSLYFKRYCGSSRSEKFSYGSWQSCKWSKRKRLSVYIISAEKLVCSFSRKRNLNMFCRCTLTK